jgi:hypothetical protein
MRSVWCLVTILLSVLLSGWAQDQPHTIRVDVQTISVDVEVFDSTGRPVIDLSIEDFSIYEDGRLQAIRNFSSADNPYNLILLFDCSSSTQAHWPLIDEAVKQFSKHKRAEDRVATAAFGSTVRVIQDWDSPIEGRFERDARTCSGTSFFKTLQWAAQKLRDVKTRRGIVVLTDGVDAHPDSVAAIEFQKAINTFRGMGIPLYFVAVGTDLNPSISVPGNPPDVRLRLEQLANVSGGHVVFPRRPEDVIPMYERIGKELGTSYSLGYAPPNPVPDGKRHRIEVRLRPANLKLRQSRDGYVWE